MGFSGTLIFLLFLLHLAISLVSSQSSNNNNTTDSWKTLTVVRDILSRDHYFDEAYGILTIEDVSSILSVKDVASASMQQSLWLNIQHDSFFAQHKLSMTKYVLSLPRNVIVNYISSPEVGFLRGIAAHFTASKTKLVFRFLDAKDTEPSTNQTYNSLLKNLTFVKTFASGILVPKSYIWPVNSKGYLETHSSIVSDAHKEGLAVFASDFANDNSFSYNYSYNPVSEYLNFIDNGNFSVDGVLSDHPITASAAIGKA